MRLSDACTFGLRDQIPPRGVHQDYPRRLAWHLRQRLRRLRGGAGRVDGEDDPVHLLVSYPPKVSVSALVNSLKGVSSRMIRKKNYPSLRKKLWGGALCSPSCFAGSCGGAPIRIIRQYIEQQQTPH
ncbi:Transposase, IS200-like [Aromatoleum bremense]|nr:Transposase, IS200-like [Aromatoleum bremense]